MTGWYLLIHQLPATPLYLRAKVRQRLSKAGAVALKKAVYVLPKREDALDRFRQIAVEIESGGGEAFVCAAEFVGEDTDQALLAAFRAERSRDYRAVATRLRHAGASVRLPALRARLDAVQAVDFFATPARSDAEAALADAERRAGRKLGSELAGRTWVTRRGIQVDRIASAWLIRRFIDPSARLRFVDPQTETIRPGELRFDMAGGEFSHEGDRCTFETLLLRSGVRDAALARVAEIVHEIDIKDGKFGRPEARGVEQVLLGIQAAYADDLGRLERGSALLDDLHASFRRQLRGGRP